MHFSTRTILAVLLEVMTPVSAWQATFHDDMICSPKDDSQYRIISGDIDGGCYVFGQDMPGTGCDKFTNGGANKAACDGEEFKIEAILVQPDTACYVYSDDHCEVGGRFVYPKNGEPTCDTYIAGFNFEMWTIKSFACTSSSNLAGSGIPGFKN
ncbi:hypothetical protein NW752_011627 [Fusarium irregulare]|uniref:Secreted LysM effector LysM C-terminal domain-containing protein n=1 Tax=Fusarium irregulare TaxID=2494466 RepID=A0A9W8PE71_9HYPO|nr:hypothetical protein NW766_012516 [Fusarium irregulare]KAJ4004530.1 hypothetical protein NW752_011627 [Fusarium irregulare]